MSATVTNMVHFIDKGLPLHASACGLAVYFKYSVTWNVTRTMYDTHVHQITVDEFKDTKGRSMVMNYGYTIIDDANYLTAIDQMSAYIKHHVQMLRDDTPVSMRNLYVHQWEHEHGDS